MSQLHANRMLSGVSTTRPRRLPPPSHFASSTTGAMVSRSPFPSPLLVTCGRLEAVNRLMVDGITAHGTELRMPWGGILVDGSPSFGQRRRIVFRRARCRCRGGRGLGHSLPRSSITTLSLPLAPFPHPPSSLHYHYGCIEGGGSILPRRYVSTSGELGRGTVEIAGCLQNQKVCICGVNDCFFAHHLTIATRAELHSEARQFLRRHDVLMSGERGRGVVDVVECIMMWRVRVRVVNGYFC